MKNQTKSVLAVHKIQNCWRSSEEKNNINGIFKVLGGLRRASCLLAG
jgi:hypothetical protein